MPAEYESALVYVPNDALLGCHVGSNGFVYPLYWAHFSQAIVYGPCEAGHSCQEVVEAMQTRGTRYLSVAPEHTSDVKIDLLQACSETRNRGLQQRARGVNILNTGPWAHVRGLAGDVRLRRLQRVERQWTAVSYAVLRVSSGAIPASEPTACHEAITRLTEIWPVKVLRGTHRQFQIWPGADAISRVTAAWGEQTGPRPSLGSRARPDSSQFANCSGASAIRHQSSVSHRSRLWGQIQPLLPDPKMGGEPTSQNAFGHAGDPDGA